jgi:indolepyruvate ferredoxin oxidoreductase, beta subunit
MNKSIMLVGVGGQGTILTSKILTEGLIRAGYDVKMSEIHGMSQRGGSVTTHIKYGEKVYSPIICKREADVVVAFEKVEALRYLDQLKSGGTIIINDLEIDSQSVQSGSEAYPTDVIGNIEKTVEHVIKINAMKIAEEVGNSKTQNIVLLGVLVNSLGLQSIDWTDVMKDLIPSKMLDVNTKAFAQGSLLS